MSLLQQYTAVIGAFQGFLLFGLLATDPRVTQASRLVGAICLILALMFCLPFVLAHGTQGPFVFAVGWLFYLPAALAGLSYLYCRNAMLDRKLAWRDLLHPSPALICMLVVADFVLFKPDALASWITGASSPSWRISLSEYLLFLPAAIYIPITMRMILRYRAQAQSELASYNPAVFRWLLMLTTALLAAWLLKAIFALTNVPTPYAFSVAGDIVLVIVIYVIAAAQWRQPELFTVEQLDEVPASPPRPAVNDAQLDPSTQSALFQTIRDAVEQGHLYQDPTLTLSGLAEATGLSTHHLSEVLNQHGGKNFYEFINTYRVDFVRQRLADDPSAKILDVAMQAGFGSKSTFNAIFKQYTGMTPTQYRRGLEEV